MAHSTSTAEPTAPRSRTSAPHVGQGCHELSAHGWSSGSCCSHGGYPYNFGVAAAFGLGGCESYPQIFEPYGGFADDTPVANGRVALTDAPGIGIEHKSALRQSIEERLG